MTDGVDPGAPSAAGPGGAVGRAGDQQAKQDVSAALDLRSADWSRLRDEAGTERGPVEYAFVSHTDGVTYVVLRPARRARDVGAAGDGGDDGTNGGDGAAGDGAGGDGTGGDGTGGDGTGGDGTGGDGAVLVFTPSEWDAFLAGARDGEFDRPPE
ncbi:DUF397 domain-containing protein [Prauserella halophila]|uniref:DUF397 domain-containing protein n=1 Tax=Prauserella halophila TaxID=185641 RepID=A0ABP4H0C5_9PSEU|nr:protein of unknown function (DUF397) [Prauserella halophila]